MRRQDTDISNPPKKVGFLTAGGLAPCLSSAVGALITEYAVKHPSVEIICYTNGYKGLLTGESIYVTPGSKHGQLALCLSANVGYSSQTLPSRPLTRCTSPLVPAPPAQSVQQHRHFTCTAARRSATRVSR